MSWWLVTRQKAMLYLKSVLILLHGMSIGGKNHHHPHTSSSEWVSNLVEEIIFCWEWVAHTRQAQMEQICGGLSWPQVPWWCIGTGCCCYDASTWRKALLVLKA